MARNRVPTAKAEVSGATVVNPARFEGRKGPKKPRPVGEPYARMTDEQKACWEELRADLPWLNRGHRLVLRSACQIAARMDEGEIGIQAIQALSALLSKLGATPVDETKVYHAEEEDEDPADKFFGKTH
jgi:hypothetical protein